MTEEVPLVDDAGAPVTDVAKIKFGQTDAEYQTDRPNKPGVRAALKGQVDASVFCAAPHGDGRARWRVAVLTKQPRRLVTDDENVSWPDAPSRTVLAGCRECWRVLCRECTDDGGYCSHNRNGEWPLDVAKLKAALGRSQKEILVVDLLATPLAEHGEAP